MFDFQKDYRFKWPVKVLVPTLDGQQVREFTGIFRLIGKEEREGIDRDHGVLGGSELVRRAWEGWGEDLTEDGKPLAFSEAKRDELYLVPFVNSAVNRAYWAAVTGALAEKN